MVAGGNTEEEPANIVKARQRRVLVGLAVTQMIGWGTTFYPIAVIGRAVEGEFNISREEAYLGLTFMLTVSALIAPRIGRNLDRNGARMTMMTGSLLGAAGLSVLALAPNFPIYLAGWTILGAMMPMALALSAFTAITQTMGTGTRRAITMMSFFTGLASTIFWPLMQAILPVLGWRAMLLVFALSHILICLPVHALVLPNVAAHRRRLSLTADEPEREGVLPPHKRLAGFILAALATSFHGIVGWGLALHFIEMFKSLGLAANTAVAIASLNGIMQVSARLADFALGSKQTPLRMGLISISMQPLAFVAILLAGATPFTAFLFILGYGMSAGLMTIVRATLPLYLFGREAYGRYAGRLTLPQNLMFGAAPVVIAAILDRYEAIAALWATLSISLGAVIAIILLSRFVREN